MTVSESSHLKLIPTTAVLELNRAFLVGIETRCSDSRKGEILLMTDNEPSDANDAPAAPTQPVRSKQSSPFDYPFTFPGLLLAIGLWFGYDGWLNSATKSIGFNRVMFVIFMVACCWTGIVDYRDMMRKRLKDAEPENDASDDISNDGN